MGFNTLCYFQSGGNSGKERQTHTKAVRQAELRGPSVSQQQPYGGQQKVCRSSLGLFLPLQCEDNPNEGQAVPTYSRASPIPLPHSSPI